MSRNYFSRAWVLQEIALARKAELICGDVIIPWRALQPKHLSDLQLLQDQETQFNGARIPPELYFDSSLHAQPNQFLQILDFASSCVAENPRDKVFSLLGLALGPQCQDLVADYTMIIAEVYIKTALCLGRHFGWGQVLEQAVARKIHIDGLPF